MDKMNILISLVAAIIGGLLALMGTILASHIKAKADRRQELMRLAVMAGMEAFKSDRINHLDTELKNFPMSYYIFFHYNFLQLLVERCGATPESVRELNNKQQELYTAIKEGAWGRAIANRFGKEPMMETEKVDSRV